MTKKQATEQLIKLWKELNSNVSKEEKVEALAKISGLIHRSLTFDPSIYNVSVDPCNMVINEFKTALESNPNYIDTLQPSNLLWFTMAVEQSLLPE
jgi:hypothetical protein